MGRYRSPATQRYNIWRSSHKRKKRYKNRLSAWWAKYRAEWRTGWPMVSYPCEFGDHYWLTSNWHWHIGNAIPKWSREGYKYGA